MRFTLLSQLTVGLISTGLMGLVGNIAHGQDYPNKPIRLITAGIGGGSDFVARLVASGITGSMGQPAIVDNRPTGVIPGQIVANAPPDGYTVLVTGSALWIGTLLEKVPYDVLKDFSAITQVEASPNVLVVHPSLPVKSVKDLLVLTKTRRGELNYGATGIGTTAHLGAELFKSLAGVDIVGVFYKTAGQSTSALLGGETQMTFASGPSSMPHVKSGRLKALAITSAQPSALFPGMPTVASGLPGYEAVGVTAIFAPAKTPAAIINRLNREIVLVLRGAEAKEKFFSAGMETETVLGPPQQLATTVQSDLAKWGKVIRDAGIKIN